MHETQTVYCDKFYVGWKIYALYFEQKRKIVWPEWCRKRLLKFIYIADSGIWDDKKREAENRNEPYDTRLVHFILIAVQSFSWFYLMFILIFARTFNMHIDMGHGS